MNRRCGFVALIGAPNAGKSTLVNALVGQKVAITSPRPQTTRSRLLGIAIEGESQIILVDTPGIFEPRRRLDRSMVAAAWAGAGEVDLVCLVIDASRRASSDLERIIAGLKESPRPTIVALNKVDIAGKQALLPFAADLSGRVEFEDLFMVSAATGDGVSDLKHALAARVSPGPWHFPEDEISNASERLLAAEATREQLFLQLRNELPHQSAVITETFTDRRDGSAEIRQQILVARDSQKAIVLGKGGTRIRAIGEAARGEIAAQLGRKIHLFLHVRVEPGWEEDRDRYREAGLDWVE